MSALINVASNLYMPSSDTFGLYNKEIVHKLLVNVQYDFSISLQKAVDMSIMYMIDYRPGNPQCCKIPNGYLIFLSSKEDEWWRWVYQFSHEYCHSLINGASSDDISGLIWFEETMCDLSSIYQLRQGRRIKNYFTVKVVTNIFHPIPLLVFSDSCFLLLFSHSLVW